MARRLSRNWCVLAQLQALDRIECEVDARKIDSEPSWQGILKCTGGRRLWALRPPRECTEAPVPLRVVGIALAACGGGGLGSPRAPVLRSIALRAMAPNAGQVSPLMCIGTRSRSGPLR